MNVPETTLSFLFIYLLYLYYSCVFDGWGWVLSVCSVENSLQFMGVGSLLSQGRWQAPLHAGPLYGLTYAHYQT